jgi:hypothetical protein
MRAGLLACLLVVSAPLTAAQAEAPGEPSVRYLSRMGIDLAKAGFEVAAREGRVPGDLSTCIANADREPLRAAMRTLMAAEFTPEEILQIDAYLASSAAEKDWVNADRRMRAIVGLPSEPGVPISDAERAVIEAFLEHDLWDRLMAMVGGSQGQPLHPELKRVMVDMRGRCSR